MEYYNTLRSGNGRYIHTTWNPVLLQKGQSYLIFADNDTTANEVDGNIYNNAYPIAVSYTHLTLPTNREV